MDIGVDADTGLAHSLATTSANESNESDVAHAQKVLHGGETDVWGDAGYTGIGGHPENWERNVEPHVAMKRGRRRKLDPEETAEKAKGSRRARVEHPYCT